MVHPSLSQTALNDFLSLAKPFADRLSPAANNVVGAHDTAGRARLHLICREALAVEAGGWPTDALFRLRKLLETLIHSGEDRRGEWQLLWEVFRALGEGRCRPFSDAGPWRVALAAALDALNRGGFAMSTWWLSIDQLHYLLLKGGDLWSGLCRIRHLTARSGDLVHEVKRSLDLNEVGQGLLELTQKMDNRAMI